jgi:GNAT superfamily N-acetyltransferase
LPHPKRRRTVRVRRFFFPAAARFHLAWGKPRHDRKRLASSFGQDANSSVFDGNGEKDETDVGFFPPRSPAMARRIWLTAMAAPLTTAVPFNRATTMSDIAISRIAGHEIEAAIPDLARLRVAVFRAWPYLYDGDEAYEAHYLKTYVNSPRAAIILARAENRIVGASTCLPLTDETDNVIAPFIAQGWDTADIFYFGESVLLPELRGRGVGVAFFNEREAHARAVSACNFAAFCAVQRPAGHPARPPDFVPLDAFWTRRGFTRRPDLACHMAWKEIGMAGETEKTLVFWLKSLHGKPLPEARAA